MSKTKFIENIWITFNYNSMFCVGKTMISEGVKIVASITDSCDLDYILFEKVDNVKQLKILKDIKFSSYKSDKRDIDFDTSTN